MLTARLASLPGLYLACEQSLEVPRQHPIRMMRGRRPSGIRLDEVAAAVRSDTVRVLSSWCELVIEERGVTGLGSLDVKALTAFLQAHLDWLVGHAVAADFAEEIVALAADAERALNPTRVRTIDLGPCAEHGCGGRVRASIGAGGQGAVPQVRCDSGHDWPPRRWLDLRRLNAPVAGMPAERSTS
ncbi:MULTISPECIES: hypothetical protein [unclassified Actinomadura]|uniref:hypothetical protein n=1 Tax=unclassified Actinomadura TaxID=2626254 RepID=UPI0011EF81C3|nr:hypothetical protein [Actinomadura sp. K4S16]